MRRIAAFIAILAAGTAPAYGFGVHLSAIDTPGLSGYGTYTFAVFTEGSEVFSGVDAMFTGSMNQVNPAGQSSIFQDSNAFMPFVGANALQDSQFTFNTGSLSHGGASESATLLKAEISGLADNGLSNPAPFAQIVTQDPFGVGAGFVFDLGGSKAVYRLGALTNALLGIEPPKIEAQIFIESEPAEGLDGYRTYTIWLDYWSDTSAARLDAEITGDLFQAPGSPSVFASDSPATHVATDSHYLFDRNNILPFEVQNEADTEGLLRGDFFFPLTRQVSSQMAIARVTTDDPSSITYDFLLDIDSFRPFTSLRLTGTLIPEPTTLLLAIAGLAAAVRVRC